MNKILQLINEEHEKDFDQSGKLVGSLEKKYFKYVCHDPDDACQLNPVVCRVVDLFQPDAEPAWHSNETGCNQCFGVNDRALEELYSRSA